VSSKTLLSLSLPVVTGEATQGTGVNRGTGNVKRIQVAERMRSGTGGQQGTEKSQKNWNLSSKNTTPGQQKKSQVAERMRSGTGVQQGTEKSQKNWNLSSKNTTPGQQKKSVPVAGSCTWGGGNN
jgi:hypothetical protein